MVRGIGRALESDYGSSLSDAEERRVTCQSRVRLSVPWVRGTCMRKGKQALGRRNEVKSPGRKCGRHGGGLRNWEEVKPAHFLSTIMPWTHN